MPLFDATSNPSTADPSCSYVQPVLPSKCPSKTLVQRLLLIESLDAQLKSLLEKKLVHSFLLGRPTDTLLQHRHKLIEHISSWILPSKETCIETLDSFFRDELLTLLLAETKHFSREIPQDESEWNKLINQWIRINSTDDVVYKRNIYYILGVDGFSGIKPKDLKHYLWNVLNPLQNMFIMHVNGVRAMYNFFDIHLDVQSLSGTDVAGVIFLALLNFYATQHPELLLDDHVSLLVQRTRVMAEGYLHKQSEYFRDLKNVNEIMLQILAELYAEQFTREDYLKNVGQKMIKQLNTNFPLNF